MADVVSRARSWLRRAVREPLVQFLGIGAALFAAYALIHGPDRGGAGDAITISEGRVNQIIESYVLLAGRAPSRAELQTLVDDYVTEEIDYREGVAMGLDADDTIVRRRIRQKLEFLVEDTDAGREPTEAELADWLATHADTYRLPERRAIRQVMASGDKRGPQALADAQAWLTKLQAGTSPDKLGDGSMLPAAMPLTTQAGVEALFGPTFAKDVFAHDASSAAGKSWFGPVPSPFGAHLVAVMNVEPGRAADLADVHDKVRSDWIEARRNAARDAHQARMRQRYHITIDWPSPYDDLPKTPQAAPKVKKAPDEVSE